MVLCFFVLLQPLSFMGAGILTWSHQKGATKDGKGFDNGGVSALWWKKDSTDGITEETKDGKVVPFQYIAGNPGKGLHSAGSLRWKLHLGLWGRVLARRKDNRRVNVVGTFSRSNC